MVNTKSVPSAQIIGGVDTHKDLHVAAVVDQHNRIAGTEFFPATRQGYRQMLNGMASFGYVKRIGVECTGSMARGYFVSRTICQMLRQSGVDEGVRADESPAC